MILELMLKWAIPTVLGGTVGTITYMLKSNHAVKGSMVLLLKSQIVGKCENYIGLGYLPSYARNCLSDLYKQFKTFTKDDGIDTLVEQCFDLPPIKKGGVMNDKF